MTKEEILNHIRPAFTPLQNGWYKQIIGRILTITNGRVTFNMVRVPGENFYIGESEVTRELWCSLPDSPVIQNNLSSPYPVNGVSYYDCQCFIDILNNETGLRFRFPTKDEWETAAYGGAESMGFLHPGSDNLDEVAWYCDKSQQLHPVKEKKPNEIGLYDMLGNVWEWCSDEVEYKRPGIFYVGDKPFKANILKGGSFMNGIYTIGIKKNKYESKACTQFHIGLRLALDVPDSETEMVMLPKVILESILASGFQDC